MRANAIWTHVTRLEPTASSASVARDFVRGHLVEHELPYLVDDIRLVVSELVTNAVVHAGTPVHVTIQGLPFCVILTVRDGLSRRPSPTVATVNAVGGRGMDVVRQVSDAWGAIPAAGGDKCVWASFAVHSVLGTALPSTA